MTTPTATAPTQTAPRTTTTTTTATTTTAHAPTVQATAPAKAEMDLDTPPELPNIYDLTDDEADQARALLASWWIEQSEEKRKRFLKRLERQRESGAIVTSRTRAIAAHYALLIPTMTQRAAAKELGLDINRDWLQISTPVDIDPILHAIHDQARITNHRRLVAKAEGVVDGALDGERVSMTQERLANLALTTLDRKSWGQDRREGPTEAKPTTAAAQVVINLGGTEAAKSCCNLLQRARDGVING